MLRLSRGGDSLIVAPRDGGAILGWTRNGTHFLRPPSPEAVLRGHPGAMGCFPLVPYCNRIAGRRFFWAGRAYELAANFGDHPHAIHGVGWHRPWDIQAVSNGAVTLRLHHDTDQDWPFAFRATLMYRLADQGLTIRLEATNLHSGPAPMGIGAHPYFPRTQGATIAFGASGVWHNRNALPDRHEPVPPAWDHTDGRLVDAEPLDNCFTGWLGTADLPSLRIQADPVFANLQVFTPRGADFFCVEPVSHVPNAINGQGMAILAPGESLRGAMNFSPR